MNITRNRTVIALCVAASALVCACTQELVETTEGGELGAKNKITVVGSDAGSENIAVLSNGRYSIELLNDADWLSFPATSEGDKGVAVSFTANTGNRRQAVLHLSLDGDNHHDTLYVRQRGNAPELKFKNAGITVKGSEASEIACELATNVPLEEIEADIEYTKGGSSWIGNVDIVAREDADVLLFAAEANESDSQVRKAVVTLSYTDGWGLKHSAAGYITQYTSSDAEGTPYTFENVRALGTADGALIENDILLQGYVVSDTASGNMGDPTMLSAFTIDYDVCRKTVYMQDAGGNFGFMLVTDTPEDNIFARYDKVTLSLAGATVTEFLNPKRYVISGVKSSMVISLESDRAEEITVRKTTIGALEDDNIYTYVELQNCELPVRKGSLTPVNEAFTNASGANRIEKYPLLVRDIEGNSMYTYTNTTCTYRRNGRRLPYGAGTMSGIIVAEPYERFDYRGTSGDAVIHGTAEMGNYQIRHVSFADFGMAEEFGTASEGQKNFQGLLTEFCYMPNINPNRIAPTHGNHGYLSHSHRDGDNNTRLAQIEDYSYLGPIGTDDTYTFGKHSGNLNGMGIMGNISDYGAGNGNVNSDGLGMVDPSLGCAWRAFSNYIASDKKFWFVAFSTEGIRTSQLSLQVGMLNNRNSDTGKFGPRFWKVEWAESKDGTGEDWASISKEEWEAGYIGNRGVSLTTSSAPTYQYPYTFSVPDLTEQSTKTQPWQSAGFKTVNISLPLEMLGKKFVYVRIIPTVKRGGSDTEHSVSVSADMPWTAMNYLAIRYNVEE